MASDGEKLKVIKKLLPGQPGARKLAVKYGADLICVRHRTDAAGQHRYTTVELLVERTPIRPRADRIVGVKIEFNEKSVRTVALAAGATWDPKAKLWRMPRRVASALNLLDRVADE